MIRVTLALLIGLWSGLVSAQTANLWIDTNGGTCTRQGTAATYVDAAACSSMDAAINACTAGDTIRMKAGTYGAQSINRTKTTPGCTIIAESTTTLTGGLKTHGAWYEIQNIDGTGWDIDNTTGGPGTNNITCRNCRFTGNSGVWWVAEGYSNISWIGGSLTNFAASSVSQAFAIWAGETAGGSSTATDILVDGVTFDDVQNTGGLGNHFETIRVDGNVNGLTIRNSTFQNNVTSTAEIFFTTFRGTKPQNITIENNFFGGLSGALYTFQMNFQGLGTCANWTFRYNTFLGSTIPDPTSGSCGSFSNVLWVGNLMPRGQCQGSTFRYNVGYGSSGSACSGTGNSVITSSGLGGTGGFYLQAGSGAIDAAAPAGSDCITTDHEGNSRPAGSNCDAGAHEFGATGGGGGGGPTPPAAPTNFRFAWGQYGF